ncbi:MAG: hypothetical protein WBB19_10470 [Desulforhopalus sp.]
MKNSWIPLRRAEVLNRPSGLISKIIKKNHYYLIIAHFRTSRKEKFQQMRSVWPREPLYFKTGSCPDLSIHFSYYLHKQHGSFRAIGSAVTAVLGVHLLKF